MPSRRDEVVEQRGREVERRDPLLLDQAQRLGGIPASLRDVAPADRVHREQGVDPHRVVERHHSERAIGVEVAVLERLAEAAGPVGRMAARHSLRPPGRARRVEEERGLPVVAIERTAVLGPVGQRIAVANHELGARVADAVVELLLGEPPRERHEDGARPLGRPVEQGRLEPVVEDDRDPVAGLDVEPTGDPRHARQQLVVA